MFGCPRCGGSLMQTKGPLTCQRCGYPAVATEPRWKCEHCQFDGTELGAMRHLIEFPRHQIVSPA